MTSNSSSKIEDPTKCSLLNDRTHNEVLALFFSDPLDLIYKLNVIPLKTHFAAVSVMISHLQLYRHFTLKLFF